MGVECRQTSMCFVLFRKNRMKKQYKTKHLGSSNACFSGENVFGPKIESKSSPTDVAQTLRLSMSQRNRRSAGNQIKAPKKVIKPSNHTISSHLSMCLSNTAPTSSPQSWPNRLGFSSFECSSMPFSLPFSMFCFVKSKLI